MSGKYRMVKIHRDFFDDRMVRHVKAKENGDSLVINYIRLIFESAKTYGVISSDITDIANMLEIPYDDAELFVCTMRHYNLLTTISENEFQVRDMNRKMVVKCGEADGRDRNSIEYRMWRKSVFDRDNYTCQTCGKRGVPVEAHHIVRWVDNMELRFDVANGITLCKPCHKKMHRRR